MKAIANFVQWVNSSDLEPETQVTNPARYHDAWKSVVSAGYVLVTLDSLYVRLHADWT